MFPKIIAIEGVDGTGKSTLCEDIINVTQGTRIAIAKTPHGITSILAKGLGFERNAGSFSAFLLSDIAVQYQFQEYEWLILDRYLLSTLVYHQDFLRQSQFDYITLLQQIGLVKPTHTIYLYANHFILEERLSLRLTANPHKESSIQLIENFENILNNPAFKPWLGNIHRMRSETPQDRSEILKKIIYITL